MEEKRIELHNLIDKFGLDYNMIIGVDNALHNEINRKQRENIYGYKQ